MALREYQLTNFKAFAGPETIPIRPITLIYGPNSSGKSSILQSLLLLKQTLEEADSSTSLLPTGKLVDLGDYREFVHRHDVSKKFSFKIFFTSDTEKVNPHWVRQLLQAIDSPAVGLEIQFSCDDEETKSPDFSHIGIFIDNRLSPVLSYRPFKLSDGRFPMFTRLDSTHDFWRAWWTHMKQYIEEELSNVDYVAYKEEPEYEPFENFRQDLKNYPFKKAIRALRKTNQITPFAYQTFLPIESQHLTSELVEKILSELFERNSGQLDLGETIQGESSTDSKPTGLSEKQTIEEYSPFAARLIYRSLYGQDLFESGLDVSPITLSVCSAFRQLVKDVVYLGPLRNYPERYYTFSGNLSDQVGKQGEQLPNLLYQYREKLLEQINEELKSFGLSYEIKLSILRDEDRKHSNVFALRIVDKETGVSASIRDVGFGVSQVLPIIVQSLLSQNKTLLIEQPEIHLHPALQAELGDLFIQSALGEQKNTFILETHSEHLLLRIMRRMRETLQGNLREGLPPVRPEDVAVLYVERDGKQSIVREMPLNERGELVKAWPGGFFEEGLREVLPTYDH
ncbi:MAG: DUF3696 domain-containing protein [Candidatus Binatia bacterium]